MTAIADRVYYDDSSALEFTAEVTAIRELARVDGKQVWQIALDRTAFYPTSGGQPYDTGTLIATARSGASLHMPITDVEEDEAGEVWHTTSKPLQEGTAVRALISEDRRRDHMQQHTGQHVLSAILDREFGARTVSFHLGEHESTIDLDGASLTDDQLRSAARKANRIIASALPLAIQYVNAGEAAAMLEQGLLRKLPPRTGSIRLVEIPGIDLNACGGTHVATTAEIGPLLLRGTETVRGKMRLSFVCGRRALVSANSDHRTLESLKRLLNCGPSDMEDGVERLLEDGKLLRKEREALLGEMAALHALQLAGDKSDAVVHILAAGRDAAYAKLLASRVVRETGASVALIATDAPEHSNLVLASKPGVVDCGSVLRQALAEHNGRGGGSAEMAQGAVAAGLRDTVLNTLRAALLRR